jgi:hypothetical protein
MVSEIFAGISSLKAAFDMTQALHDIHDAAARDRAVIELQKEILAAQAAQSQLLETVGELKKRVTELETWEAEKQRYDLKDVGRGSLAYVIKESMRGSEPPHQICANCYQHGRKSILQPRGRGMTKLLVCAECKAEIVVGTADISRSLLDQPVRRTRYSPFE